MRFEFKLPDIGEGVVEGEVVKWLVADGDQVAAEQPVVEVMTDKATVVIPSPKAGKVVQRSGKEGEMIKVHSTLLGLETEGGAAAAAPDAKAAPAPSAPKAAAPAAPAKPAAPAPVANLSAVRPAPTAVAAPVAVAAAPKPAAPLLQAVPPLPPSAPPANGEVRVRATPVPRKLAAESGLDLSTVTGSGPAGRRQCIVFPDACGDRGRAAVYLEPG